jgi:hypothetical protein
VKEPKSKEQKPKEQTPKKEDPGVLESAAEKIGATLGAIAVKTGIAHPGAQVSQKIAKLPKKNKSRLPRKMKKQARKVQGAGGAKPS